MKIVFFGLGSIGQKFYKLIKNEYPGYECFALRTPKRLNRNEYYGILPARNNLWSWGEVDSIKPDVAVITNPTYCHIDTATLCAERGMHLFIAKPLDCRLDNSLTHLQDLISANCLTSYLAYPLRHLSIVKELKLKSYDHTVMRFVCNTDISKWRSYKTYSAQYDQGGGALLELSHELDLAVYLLGDVLKISGSTFNLEDTETDAEDMASLVMHHKYGNHSFHTLNLISDIEERYIEFDNIRYDIIPDDQMFIDMFKYFFDNIGNMDIDNNILEASRFYETLIEFRELTRGVNK